MAELRMRRLCLFALGFALIVVVLGAFTRLSDAGLGCPDWPGCYGFLSVPQTSTAVALASDRFPDAPVEPHKAWWEMVHRYFAGALGLIILALAALAIIERRRGSAHLPGAGGTLPFAGPTKEPVELPLKLPLALVLLVVCQAAFGAWTVTLKLWPQVVTGHLLGGFATLSLLWLMCLRLGVGRRWQVPGRFRVHALVALVLVVVQIALGGWVSSNYAALACPDFPTCHGQWLPHLDMAEGFNIAQGVGPNYLGGQMESDARVAIQLVHRGGALIVLIVVGWLGGRLAAAGSTLAWPVLGVLGLQILLGIMNVVLVLPLWNATLHNAVGALLLLALVLVNYRAFRDGPDI